MLFAPFLRLDAGPFGSAASVGDVVLCFSTGITGIGTLLSAVYVAAI